MKQVRQEDLQNNYFSKRSAFTRFKRVTTLHMYIEGGG